MKNLVFLSILVSLTFLNVAFAQCDPMDYDFDQNDLIGSSGTFVIPAGQVLAITSDVCIGSTANWPAACPNSGPSSINILGTLRICPNVTFGYMGNFFGGGTIQYLGSAEVNHHGTLDCGLGLQMDAIDPDYSTNPTDTEINGGCNISDACAPQIVNDGSYVPYSIVTAGLGFTTGGGCRLMGFPDQASLLPVNLLSFTAKHEGSDILLQWSTQQEINNDFFIVQSSIDGEEWSDLGTIAGAGTTSIVQHYSFIDRSASKFAHGSLIYYRLVQYDYNGQFEYFETKSVFIRDEVDDFVLAPNPFQNVLYITKIRDQSRSKGIVRNIKVYDMLGNMIFLKKVSLSKDQGDLKLDLSNLNTGTYLIRLYTENGKNIASQKIQKI